MAHQPTCSKLRKTTQVNALWGIVPRELVADFKRAIDSYFLALEGRLPQEAEAIQFNNRFEEVYLNKARPPLP